LRKDLNKKRKFVLNSLLRGGKRKKTLGERERIEKGGKECGGTYQREKRISFVSTKKFRRSPNTTPDAHRKGGKRIKKEFEFEKKERRKIGKKKAGNFSGKRGKR